ncbi:hypothetical protein GCM10011316_30870 [Roseibium aquae]|uniref:DUF6898 domain-containing protein n=1 Tax=Roseibium aquae TaxID=1323746 RepID=A0A916X2V5_9HYPH|nr:serine hydroxymethyltransferase [Roseibium aquae]GGB56562.1 hypothetical protein GCM10011316_30870 [Roseibium aquae]
MNHNTPSANEVYFEFRQVGQQIRVTAIDGGSGIEVVIFGPLNVPQHDLKNLAMRKLLRRLEREEPERGEEFRKRDGRGFGTY